MRNVQKRWYVIIGIAIALLLFNIGFYVMGTFFPHVLNKGNITLPQRTEEKKQFDTSMTETIATLALQSQNVSLIDLQDTTVLFEKNSTDRVYPASITKVMSAVVALDHMPDLTQTVIVEEKDLQGLVEANASVAGLKVGDCVTYEDLLYALILPSGADAANVIANHLFGGMDAFVQEMNNKAASIGMKDSHFVNASGLHDDNHYTTISDLNRMMKHAWINTAFRKVMTTTTYTIPSTQLELNSTLRLYGDSLGFTGGDIIGGKSGYTPEAGCCLASVAKLSNDHLFMLITTGASGSPVEDHRHIDDAKLVYETVAKQYEKVEADQ